MNRVVPRIRIAVTNEHKNALVTILESGDFVTGKALDEFSKSLAKGGKKKYAVLTANGFSALYLAVKSKGWNKYRIAIPAASTCFAILNAVRSSGNTPVFVDSDLSTGNMCTKDLETKFHDKEIDAAITPSHFGILNDLSRLNLVGLPVIEDNAQAVLSVLNNGSSAEVITLSFYPTKILNGIDGGGVLTDNKEIYELCRDLVYYDTQSHDDGKERYNFRMNNINAAFANATMQELSSYIEVMRRAEHVYRSVIDLYPQIAVLGNGHPISHIKSKYVIKFPDIDTAHRFEEAMLERGIEVSSELVMMCLGCNNDFPHALRLSKETRSLPFRESLTDAEIALVKVAVTDVLNEMFSHG